MLRLAPRGMRRAPSEWLPLICGLTVVALFIVARIALRLGWLAMWAPLRDFLSSGWDDALSLVGLALAAGLLVHVTQLRTQRRIDTLARSEQRIETLLRENAAVVRACRAIAREFAQPLTGALAYSEMLMADGEYSSDHQRHEVEGVREGVLRMERLLRSLLDAVSDEAIGNDRCIADEIEFGIGSPLPRRLFRREA